MIKIIIIYFFILLLLCINEKTNLKNRQREFMFFESEMRKIVFRYKFIHYFSLFTTFLMTVFVLSFFYYILDQLLLINLYISSESFLENGGWEDKKFREDLKRLIWLIFLG